MTHKGMHPSARLGYLSTLCHGVCGSGVALVGRFAGGYQIGDQGKWSE
jgi:hypothetical protein